MYSLQDKVAIITGGADGIGAEIVKEFLKENAKFVAILDINKTLGASLEKELKIKHGEQRVRFFESDVTNDEHMFKIFYKVSEEFGAIDVIVNNAGIAMESQDLFKKEIEVNFTALVVSSLKGIELMRKDEGGKGGTIINISSIAPLTQFSPALFVYSATKSAVLQFSNCIGMEPYFSHTNVRVLTVCFGPTDTNILKDYKGIDDVTTNNLNNILQKLDEDKLLQSPTVAAQGVVHSYKSGTSGSTWVVNDNKIVEVTSDVKDAYKIMSKHVTA